jgi:CDP-4-dehydro-6-deoxyglucose reductase
MLIVLDPKGQATNYLFHECKVGSEIRMSEPMGKFILPENIEKELCFICTGVGLAPLRSMIHDVFKRNVPHKDIHLVFGTRYLEDLVYYEEFQNLQREFPEFHYHVTLSRETEDKWDGKKGYVHNVYKEIYSDKRDANFYICGYKGMINDARRTLHEIGYTKDDINFEKFD